MSKQENLESLDEFLDVDTNQVEATKRTMYFANMGSFKLIHSVQTSSVDNYRLIGLIGSMELVAETAEELTFHRERTRTYRDETGQRHKINYEESAKVYVEEGVIYCEKFNGFTQALLLDFSWKEKNEDIWDSVYESILLDKGEVPLDEEVAQVISTQIMEFELDIPDSDLNLELTLQDSYDPQNDVVRIEAVLTNNGEVLDSTSPYWPFRVLWYVDAEEDYQGIPFSAGTTAEDFGGGMIEEFSFDFGNRDANLIMSSGVHKVKVFAQTHETGGDFDLINVEAEIEIDFSEFMQTRDYFMI